MDYWIGQQRFLRGQQQTNENKKQKSKTKTKQKWLRIKAIETQARTNRFVAIFASVRMQLVTHFQWIYSTRYCRAFAASCQINISANTFVVEALMHTTHSAEAKYVGKIDFGQRTKSMLEFQPLAVRTHFMKVARATTYCFSSVHICILRFALDSEHT